LERKESKDKRLLLFDKLSQEKKQQQQSYKKSHLIATHSLKNSEIPIVAERARSLYLQVRMPRPSSAPAIFTDRMASIGYLDIRG
jgi:hypothetical protein